MESPAGLGLERSPSSETAPLSRATSRSKSPSSQRSTARANEDGDRLRASSSKPIGRSERGRKLPVPRKKSRTTARRAIPRAITPSDAATTDDEVTDTLEPVKTKNTSTRHSSSPLSDYNSKSPSLPPASSPLRPTEPTPSSTHSTPAPAKTVTPAGSSDESDTDQGFSSKLAPRGRGRPKGRKFPNPKTTTRRPTTSAPSSVGRNSPVADFMPMPRATRATVALPPGYIEGVKSTRMPRAFSVRAESSGVEEDAKPKKSLKGKEREVPKEVEMEATPEKVVLALEIKDLPALPTNDKTPETSPVSKRRKIEADAAARTVATKQRLNDQLDQEAALINNATHPLIQHTYARLAVEKALRLSQLVDLREQTAMQIDRNLEVETEAVWRQWADSKDTLRMELYFANHDHLKQLISEEREYPFIRDHPLLVNSHGLPPTPYFRAPLPPPFPGESRRHDIKSTSHLDAPPYNRALDHSAWKLTPSEVEADLAIFAEFSTPYPTSRSLSVTIEQPYGAVHYPPVLPTPPAVFQPPSAAVASSYFSQHPSSAPRLPHDPTLSNRPPTNIFPTPSSVAPRWSASGSGSPLEIPPRKNITTTHSHVQQGSLVLPSKPVHSNSNPGPRIPPAGASISPGGGYRELNHREGEYRARTVVPAVPAKAESSNWFAHPRPVDNRPRQEVKSTLPHALAPIQQPAPRPTPPPSNAPVAAQKKPTESWMDWRPTPRTNNEIPAFNGRPSDNPRPPFAMYDRPAPPSNTSSSNSTTSTSAFAAFQPQAIPLFNGGKGSRTPVVQGAPSQSTNRVG